MNTLLPLLLTASIVGLLLSGSVFAGPHYLDGVWLAARSERDMGKEEEQNLHKTKKQPDKKSIKNAENEGLEQSYGYGYGYGYERRKGQKNNDIREYR